MKNAVVFLALVIVAGVSLLPDTSAAQLPANEAAFVDEGELALLADDPLYQYGETPQDSDQPPLYQEEQPLYSESVLMTSDAVHLRVREGELVTFPCTWETTADQSDDDVVVLWKKMPSAILFTNTLRMSQDERLRVTGENSLEIRRVVRSDAGEYACTLSLTPQPPQVQHTLTVLVPPQMEPNAEERYRVRAGDKFELVCRAQGVPAPTVSWSKLPVQDTEGPYIDDGEALAITNLSEGDDLAYLRNQPQRGVAVTFDPVEPHHAGTYTCTAQNGVGQPATSVTSVEVIHAPYIRVDQPVVRTAIGLEAELACKVFANPRAEVRWERNAEPLPVDPRYETVVSRRFFSLKIRHVQEEDLANYTCRAHNDLGRSEHHITLTGLPGPLQLSLSQPEKRENGSLSSQLSWQLVSFAPLQQLTVSLQSLKPTGAAPVTQRLTPPPTRSVARSGSVTLVPLVADTEYQVRVSASNGYGSSEPATQQFQISAQGQLTLQQETPRLAESHLASTAERLARVKLTAILLITILSCFLW